MVEIVSVDSVVLSSGQKKNVSEGIVNFLRRQKNLKRPGLWGISSR